MWVSHRRGQPSRTIYYIYMVRRLGRLRFSQRVIQVRKNEWATCQERLAVDVFRANGVRFSESGEKMTTSLQITRILPLVCANLNLPWNGLRKRNSGISGN